MSEKNSLALKKRWAGVSPTERSKIASGVAKKKWAQKTHEERIAHSRKMTLALKRKRKNAKTS